MGWLSGFTYRKKLTIDHNDIDSTLTNFPVLVAVTDARVPTAHVISDNGHDIKFTSSDGETLLNHENVNYYLASGQFWVRIPSISSTVDTDFYVYYGKAGQSDTSTIYTWDANDYVWHLEDTTDSKDGKNLVTDGSDPTLVACKIDNGYDFNNNWWKKAGWFDFDGDITFEGWVKWDTWTDSRTLLEEGWLDGADQLINYWFGVHGGALAYGLTDTASVTRHYYEDTSTWTATPGTWYWITIVVDEGTNVKFYVDDVLKSTITQSELHREESNATFRLGAGLWFDGFDGKLDEIRMGANITKINAAWVKASYESGRDDLITYGLEKTAPTVTTQAATVVNLITATGNGNITDDGGLSITQHGVCWSTSENPTTADSKTEEGAGSEGAFTSSITGLTAGQVYHYRAYAINEAGTSYGSDETFVDLPHIGTFSDDGPVDAGQDITFTIPWTWSDIVNNADVFVCKTNAFNGTSCTGGEWAHATNVTTPEDLEYTTTVDDGGSNDYFVFIVDTTYKLALADNNGASGSFTVNIPEISSVVDDPDPVLIDTNITFTVDWDWSNNVDVRICKTDSLTAGVCDGGEWASVLDTASDPVDLVYRTENVGLKDYYAFVCDHTTPIIASASTHGTFDVNRANVFAHFELHRGSSFRVSMFVTGINCSIVDRRNDYESVRNKIQVLGALGIKSAIQEDLTSQNDYGIREFTYTDRSIESVADANKLALNILSKLKDPVEVIKLKIDLRNFTEVIGDVISITDVNTGLDDAEYRIIEINRKFSNGVDELIYEAENKT